MGDFFVDDSKKPEISSVSQTLDEVVDDTYYLLKLKNIYFEICQDGRLFYQDLGQFTDNLLNEKIHFEEKPTYYKTDIASLIKYQITYQTKTNNALISAYKNSTIEERLKDWIVIAEYQAAIGTLNNNNNKKFYYLIYVPYNNGILIVNNDDKGSLISLKHNSLSKKANKLKSKTDNNITPIITLKKIKDYDIRLFIDSNFTKFSFSADNVQIDFSIINYHSINSIQFKNPSSYNNYLSAIQLPVVELQSKDIKLLNNKNSGLHKSLQIKALPGKIVRKTLNTPSINIPNKSNIFDKSNENRQDIQLVQDYNLVNLNTYSFYQPISPSQLEKVFIDLEMEIKTFQPNIDDDELSLMRGLIFTQMCELKNWTLGPMEPISLSSSENCLDESLVEIDNSLLEGTVNFDIDQVYIFLIDL